MKKDSKILPTPTKSSRGDKNFTERPSFVKRLRRLSSSDCMSKKDFEKALTRKFSSCSNILFNGYLERHTTGETSPSRRKSKTVTGQTKKRTGVRLGRAWMTSDWKKCWVCVYAPSSFDERDEARGALLISDDAIDHEEIPEILVTKRKGVEVLCIDMATEIVDVSLSASTSNGDEETYGVSHFSIYVGGKDIYFRSKHVEQWREHVVKIVDHIQSEMQKRMQRSSEIASKQLSLLESDEKTASTLSDSNLVILKQSLQKKGQYRKSKRDVILTTTHLRWSTSSSSEYRSVSLSDIASVDDGDSTLEFRVKTKSEQEDNNRCLYFFASDRRHGTLWKVVLQRVLATYEAQKQKSVRGLRE